MTAEEKLAQGLGWFSIGLGLTELLAPKALGKWLGLEEQSALLQFYGMREIGAGLGILSQRAPGKPAGWVWGRVGGDTLDIATLAYAARSDNPRQRNAQVALAAVAGITAVDIYCAQRLSQQQQERAGDRAKPGVIERSLTIGKPASELYRLWDQPDIKHAMLSHFAEVTSAGTRRFHWKIPMPLGQALEFDTEIVEEIPDSRIRWQSLPGSPVTCSGSALFVLAPGDRGTEVKLHMSFDPPGGAIGDAVVKLFGPAPNLIADKALRRFKSIVETGEIPTTCPQPAARTDKD